GAAQPGEPQRRPFLLEQGGALLAGDMALVPGDVRRLDLAHFRGPLLPLPFPRRQTLVVFPGAAPIQGVRGRSAKPQAAKAGTEDGRTRGPGVSAGGTGVHLAGDRPGGAAPVLPRAGDGVPGAAGPAAVGDVGDLCRGGAAGLARAAGADVHLAGPIAGGD